MKSPRVAAALALIVLFGVGVAFAWSVRVPFMQETDEQAHADYAYRLYDGGGWFAPTSDASADFATPQTRYLAAVSNFVALRASAEARAPARYGTIAYFRRIDRHAPRPTVTQTFRSTPYVAFQYPVGYYALAAAAMRVAARVTGGSLAATFFAARWLGVAFLVPTLLTSYALLRALRLSARVALPLTAAIGVLPLTSWFSSSIQPDTLVFFLVTLFLYLALRWRERAFAPTRTALLASTVYVTFFVKPHYALVLLAALALLLASRIFGVPGRARMRIALTSGVLAAGGLACIVAVSCNPIGTLRAPSVAHAHVNAGALAGYGLEGVRNIFWAGDAFSTFWLFYGDLVAPYSTDPAFVRVAAGLLSFASMSVLLLLAVRQLRVWRSLCTIARRRPARALRLFGGDVVLNTYALWSLFIIAVYAISGGVVYPEGRYFLPLVCAAIAMGTVYVPRAFARAHRGAVGAVFALGWCAFAFVTAPVALVGMSARFYGPAVPQDAIVRVTQILGADGRTYAFRTLDLKGGTPITVRGTVYFEDPAASRGLVARLDGRPVGLHYARAISRRLGMRTRTFVSSIRMPAGRATHRLEFELPGVRSVGDGLQLTDSLSRCSDC